jgi:hypothetical protein
MDEVWNAYPFIEREHILHEAWRAEEQELPLVF